MPDNELKNDLTKSIAKSDPRFLEGLEEDFQAAKKRVDRRGLGAPKSEREQRGFIPSALRIRGELVGKDELSRLNLSIGNIIKDIDSGQQFADARTQALERDKLFRATSDVRKLIISRGSQLGMELEGQKLDTRVRGARMAAFADVFQSAGFAMGLAATRGQNSTGLSDADRLGSQMNAGGAMQTTDVTNPSLFGMPESRRRGSGDF